MVIKLRYTLTCVVLLILADIFYFNNLQKFTGYGVGLNGHNASEIFKFHRYLANQERKSGRVLSVLIDLMSLNESRGYYVQLGAYNHTDRMKKSRNWMSIVVDWDTYRRSDNVLRIFETYKLNASLDILIEHGHYANYWILESILEKYSPKMVVHKVNGQLPELCATILRPTTHAEILTRDDGNLYGASVCAFYCLARRFSFTMVYCESSRERCYWIRDDLVEAYLHTKARIVQEILNPVYLYHSSIGFSTHDSSKSWTRVDC